MATTSAPSSLASWATTGADPVPVPPPMPARTNTRSAPLMSSSSSCFALWAAFLPTSGSPPAPMPRVSFRPIRIFFSAWTVLRCWLSVFMATVFAPLMPILTRRLTVLLPAPPQPMTRILGLPKSSAHSENSKDSPKLHSIPNSPSFAHNQIVVYVNNNCGRVIQGRGLRLI